MSKGCLPLLLAALLLTTLPVQADLQLQLEAAHSSTAQQQASLQLLDEVQQLLPPRMRKQMEHSVVVRWSANLPDNVMGRATAGGQILLNQRWLDILVAQPATPNLPGRQHPNLRSELKATLIHELAHLYDRDRYWPDKQRRLINQCRSRQRVQGLTGLPERCHGQSTRRYTLSDDPQLLELAGWPQLVGRPAQHSSDNHQALRSPDRYELTNPQEFIAVNLEYFLLDPEYACRRPALAQWLQQHFAWTPAHSLSCATELPYLNAGLDQKRPILAWLNPERIYQAHYLLAEPDNSWAGRWGHSMLRLVICAPGREPGPDCLLDLQHHLVLSYRAFVDDLQLSSWDGLTGVYPSRLFILPLQQVVDEYARTELRSLSSVPLNLDSKQLRQLAIQAITQHWSYDGNYYFVSNNCAVETLKLLRSGSAHPRLQSLDSQTPAGLLRAMQGRNLADYEPLENRHEAMRLGYYFDSHRERYQQLFAMLRQHLQLPLSSFTDWLALSANQRQQLAPMRNQRITAALLVLEQAALRQYLHQLRNELKMRYLDQQGSALAEAGQLMTDILLQSGFLSRPADLFKQGYGLPQPADWQTLDSLATQRHQHLLNLGQALEASLPELLEPAQLNELHAIQSNLQRLDARLKQLHQQASGLILP